MSGERIREWYSGRSILVTGGTGFMGKVLIEKLLRACPEINKIYLLIRPKHGKTSITRLAELITKTPVFERLKKENPLTLNKLEAIDGDVTYSQVVTKEKDRDLIAREVSVVFHLAASLRLEAPMKPCIESNAIGTLNLLNYCKTFTNLKIFVHHSTAFCHVDYDVLEEEIYPPPKDPYEIIKLVNSLDEEVLTSMTPSILGVHPNCYTYSKRLAETLVDEFSKHFPALIIRPSIVTPAIYEPMAGWVDSLNGPVGIMVGAGKGVIRSMLCEPNNRAETVPVDVAVNAIISITAKHHHKISHNGVPCYNISSGELVPVTWGEVLERGRKQFFKYPFEWGLWYPSGQIRTNPWTHALIVFLFQTIPAYLIDSLLFVFGQKRFMVRIQNRIAVGMEVLQYFTMRQWNIKIDRGIFQQMKSMHKEDQKVFYIDNVDKDIDRYLLKVILGARQYCLKEPLSTLRKARVQLFILFLLDISVKVFFFVMLYSGLSELLKSIDSSYKLPMPHDLF